MQKELPLNVSEEVWLRPDYAIARFMGSKAAYKTGQGQGMICTAKVIQESGHPLQVQFHFRFGGRDEWFEKDETVDVDVYMQLSEFLKMGLFFKLLEELNA